MAIEKYLKFPARKLSYIEYGHSFIGACKHSNEKPRENTIVIEGCGDIDRQAFQHAIDLAAEANPSVRLKLKGNRQRASWVDSGIAPAARVVERCEWDGNSIEGSEFIYEKHLSAYDGVIAEFVIAKASRSIVFLIFRSLHSAMDGLGCIHFIEEVFRALNKQDLAGSNIFISNTELMRRVKATRQKIDSSKKIAKLTGDSAGSPPKDLWRRLTFKGSPMWLLAKVAASINEYCQQYGDGAVRVAVPVNLRRHAPGKQTTLNYAVMTYIDMDATDNLATFNKKLHALASNNSEAFYGRCREIIRYIPMSWLDFFLSGNARAINKKRKHFATAAVSDLGRLPSGNFSTDGFKAEHLYGIPMAGSILCIISTLDETINIAIGMREAGCDDGRFEDFAQYMNNTFAK